MVSGHDVKRERKTTTRKLKTEFGRALEDGDRKSTTR
jgi:hypothetical protein